MSASTTHPQDHSLASLPPDVQARMRDIIALHSRNYRNDLPALVGSLRRNADRLGGGDMGDALAAVEREAHDMKGQSATFGLPVVASVADSLCNIASRPRMLSGMARMVQSHVACLERIVLAQDESGVAALLEQARAWRDAPSPGQRDV